jgi:hypothetical protein
MNADMIRIICETGGITAGLLIGFGLLLIIALCFVHLKKEEPAQTPEPAEQPKPESAQNPQGKEEALAAVQHVLEYIRDDSTSN